LGRRNTALNYHLVNPNLISSENFFDLVSSLTLSCPSESLATSFFEFQNKIQGLSRRVEFEDWKIIVQQEPRLHKMATLVSLHEIPSGETKLLFIVTNVSMKMTVGQLIKVTFSQPLILITHLLLMAHRSTNLFVNL